MRIGEVIDGKYELVARIGAGGMGAVYEARHTLIGKRLAVKLLHNEMSGQPDLARRFILEAQAAAAIGSQHIVDVTDAGFTADGDPYIVMEHLEGESLAALLKREGQLSPRRAAALTVQLCRGLGAAHARGIIHRDLKPENLFLTAREDGAEWIKVLDFGIAKFRPAMAMDGPSLTATGSVLGTPYYMSLEQLRETKDVDERADVYSAGVILFELLTGELPFEAATFGDLLLLVADADPPAPSTRRPELDEAIDRVVQKAMARQREGRFASMTELSVELEPFAGGARTGLRDAGLEATVQSGPALPATEIERSTPAHVRDEPPHSMPDTVAVGSSPLTSTTISPAGDVATISRGSPTRGVWVLGGIIGLIIGGIAGAALLASLTNAPEDSGSADDAPGRGPAAAGPTPAPPPPADTAEPMGQSSADAGASAASGDAAVDAEAASEADGSAAPRRARRIVEEPTPAGAAQRDVPREPPRRREDYIVPLARPDSDEPTGAEEVPRRDDFLVPLERSAPKT